jgi:16S rRNA G1207 methylase RsmC
LIRFVAGEGDGPAFHDVAAGRAELSSPEVSVPAYRGKRLLPVLSWLVTRRPPGSSFVWRVERRIGPDFVRRELAPLGWELTASREGRSVLLSGAVPAAHPLPPPRSFTVSDGLEFEADYGVFSPGGIDAGSALLLEVAGRLPAVDAVADVGVGYGALAISLVARGTAARAVGTDVDSIALWLAERNAAAAGVPLEVVLDPDPLAVERTPLTVSNIPTHLDAPRTAALVAGLVERARDGRLLAVVHASLEERYARHLKQPGLRLTRHPGSDHVVLELSPSSR